MTTDIEKILDRISEKLEDSELDNADIIDHIRLELTALEEREESVYELIRDAYLISSEIMNLENNAGWEREEAHSRKIDKLRKLKSILLDDILIKTGNEELLP